MIKRSLDMVLSLGALIFLLPLFVVVAIAIKWNSPGPVIFRQRRVGRSGAMFDVLKFRTMYSDRGDESGVKQTKVADSRVTKVGRLLRAKNIDELPQLINVLRGDMSLVGPRPHVPLMLAGGKLYDELVPYYELRNRLAPGITGWAQANGFRGPTDDADLAKARVDHDIAYIQNFSVILDLKALWMTVRREMTTGSGF